MAKLTPEDEAKARRAIEEMALASRVSYTKALGWFLTAIAVVDGMERMLEIEEQLRWHGTRPDSPLEY
jgi:DNA-binding GntR family transcriptional regulator